MRLCAAGCLDIRRARTVRFWLGLLAFALASSPIANAAGGDGGDASRGYPGLSDQAAYRLFRDHFEELANATWRSPLANTKVEARFSDHAARVRQEGRPQLVLSSLPLWTETLGGRRRTDLNLIDDGAYVAPRNPLAASRFGVLASDGLQVRGRRIGLRGARAARGITRGAVVFYPNAATDTDLVGLPTPHGVELFSVLRSSASPESQTFNVELGQGEQLVAGEGRALIRREGKTLVEIRAPWAFAADGQRLLPEVAVSGNAVSVTLPHRGKDLEYPILVDPEVRDYHDPATDWYTSSSFYQAVSGAAISDFDWFRGQPAGVYNQDGNGLYIWARQGQFYDAGDAAYWRWQYRGASDTSSTYLTRAGFYRPILDNYVSTTVTLRLGIVGLPYYEREQGYDCFCWRTVSAPPGDLIRKTALFGFLRKTSANAEWGTKADTIGADFMVGDLDLPSTPTLSGLPAGWTDLTKTPTATASDGGLGIQAFVTGPVAGLGPDQTAAAPCLDPWRPCPSPWSAALPTPAAEGTHDLRVYAKDPVNQQSLPATYQLKIDRNPPSLSRSGSLYTGAGGTVSPSASVTVSATDSYSGVKSIRFYVGGTEVERYPATDDCSATSQCPTSRSKTFTLPANITPGTYTIDVRAFDALNHGTAPNPWTVTVDTDKPTLAASGPLWDRRDGAFFNTVAPVHLEASDTSSDVAQIVLSVDGTEVARTGSCPADPCVLDHELEPAIYDAGSQPITAVAIDRGGNTETLSWTVKPDAIEPSLLTGGALWDKDDGVVAEASSDLDVEITDGYADAPEAGAQRIEITVDGDPVLTKTQPVAGASTLEASWSFDSAVWGDGAHSVIIQAFDAVGNEATERIDVWVAQAEPAAPRSVDTAQVNPSVMREDFPYPWTQSGSSLANLGDLNADGYDDFATGVPNLDWSGRTKPGGVFVYHGGATPADVTLAFYIIGAQNEDLTGTAIAAAGDVNGDGRGDLVIGAPRVSGGGTIPARSKVYVVFGQPWPTNIDLADLGNRGFVITGPVNTNALLSSEPAVPFGAAVAAHPSGMAGYRADINGDGKNDLLLGSSLETKNGLTESGAAYVVFGKADAQAVDLALLGNAGFEIDGPAAGARAGSAVAIAGDLNDDERADLVIGAPGASSFGRTGTGNSYVVFGKADTAAVDLRPLASGTGGAGYRLDGASGDRLGNTVAGLGDLNSDGLADIAVGGRNAYVVLGKASTGSIDLAGAFAGYRLTAPAGSGYDKAVLAAGSDLNGDFLPDLLIGYPGASPDPLRPRSGEVFVVSGRAQSAPISLGSITGDLGTRFVGAAADDEFGTSLAGADELNLADSGFFVGAPKTASSQTADNYGSVYAVESQATAAAARRSHGWPCTPPQSSTSSVAERRTRDCGYRGQTTPYSFKRAFDHPNWRMTHNGNRDNSPGGESSRRRLAKLDPASTTIPGYGVTGWRVVDSTGATFAYLRQTRNTYRLYKRGPNGTWQFYGRTVPKPRARVQVQGRACMSTKSLEDTYVMVFLVSGPEANNQGLGPDPADPSRTVALDVGMRGFIPRGAIPPGALPTARDEREGRNTNSDVIDRYRTGCGRVGSNTSGGSFSPPVIAKPGFALGEWHQGASRNATPPPPNKPNAKGAKCYEDNLKEQDPECGLLYRDYNRPDFDRDVITVMSATTGVRAGGIVRALVSLSGLQAGDWRATDYIRYVDPNVPCSDYDKAGSGSGVGAWRAGCTVQ